MTPRAFLALLALLGALVACRGSAPVRPEGRAAGKGVLHTVQKGQTLWRIARAYEIGVQELAEVNDLPDPTQIKVGQTLWVPNAARVLEVDVAPAPGAQAGGKTTSVQKGPPEPKIEVNRSRFSWPVKGVLYSRFGVRGGVQHDGIDISCAAGTPVLAADDGEVLFAGTQRGYGNLVLLRHADGLITIYAHNARNETKAGAKVRRGERIAIVGQTGRASGPHLHFEVRHNRLPRNPLFYLPDGP